MARTIQIGGTNRGALALQEAPPLPLLGDELIIGDHMHDALHLAIAQRTGVAVVAIAGAGKSIATAVAVQDFNEQEAADLRADGQYDVRRVAVMSTVRSIGAFDFYRAVYTAAFGTPPAERTFRRRRTPDEIRDELADRLRQEHVVALVIDEAQTLEPSVLFALRDLMAIAAQRDGGGIEQAPKTQLLRPAGIGVLLVGTMDLDVHLQRHESYGRRFTKVRVVGTLEDAQVPDVLRKMLPAFDRGARALGAEWPGFVQRMLARCGVPSIAILTDIVRTYVYRAGNEQNTLGSIENIPWDIDLFEQAVTEQADRRPVSQDAA